MGWGGIGAGVGAGWEEVREHGEAHARPGRRRRGLGRGLAWKQVWDWRGTERGLAWGREGLAQAWGRWEEAREDGEAHATIRPPTSGN